MMKVVVTTGAVTHAKQSLSQIVTTNKATHSFKEAGCLHCRPTNSVRALKGKGIAIHGLAHPKSLWGSSNLVSDRRRLLVIWGEVKVKVKSAMFHKRA